MVVAVKRQELSPLGARNGIVECRSTGIAFPNFSGPPFARRSKQSIKAWPIETAAFWLGTFGFESVHPKMPKQKMSM